MERGMGRVAHIQQVMSDGGQCMTRGGSTLRKRTLYTSYNGGTRLESFTTFSVGGVLALR